MKSKYRTIRGYNLDYWDNEYSTNHWGFPDLIQVDYKPTELIGFNYAKTSKRYTSGVHFYLDDYQFERLWSHPEDYINLLKKFDCVFTPDFSLYVNMPRAMQIWNTYRSRLIGYILTLNGITVIPTVSWSDRDSFDWCFEGLPRESTLSISTIGVVRDKAAFELWKDGVKEMIKRLSPKRLLVVGNKVDFDFGDIEVVYYDTDIKKRKDGYKWEVVEEE